MLSFPYFQIILLHNLMVCFILCHRDLDRLRIHSSIWQHNLRSKCTRSESFQISKDLACKIEQHTYIYLRTSICIHISTYICINTYLNVQKIHAHLYAFFIAKIINTYTSNTYIRGNICSKMQQWTYKIQKVQYIYFSQKGNVSWNGHFFATKSNTYIRSGNLSTNLGLHKGAMHT